jgi:hypothetical protein
VTFITRTVVGCRAARKPFNPVVAVISAGDGWLRTSLDLWLAAPIYAAALFACCMFCHGELYRLKPGPRYLTTFYLMISLGALRHVYGVAMPACWPRIGSVLKPSL